MLVLLVERIENFMGHLLLSRWNEFLEEIVAGYGCSQYNWKEALTQKY